MAGLYAIENEIGLSPSRLAQREPVHLTMPQLLLANPATAIFSLIESPQGFEPYLIAANYHGSVPEGHFKIAVQDVPKRKGPWVLFDPPKAKERTFYLQDLRHRLHLPIFSRNVKYPESIKQRYVYSGNPLDIFTQWRDEGYDFIDEPVSSARNLRLKTLYERSLERRLA